MSKTRFVGYRMCAGATALSALVIITFGTARCAPKLTESAYRVARDLDGSPAELKGLKRVFVDTSQSHEAPMRESRERIVSSINEAQLGVEVVTRLEDAEIVLTFRYFEGAGPPGDRLPFAEGEVNVVRAGGLRVVARFKEEWRVWRRHLAEGFGSAFVRAYREVNGTK